jgi:hypothetical protein
MLVAIYARVSTDKQDNETNWINTATPEILKTGKRWRPTDSAMQRLRRWALSPNTPSP